MTDTSPVGNFWRRGCRPDGLGHAELHAAALSMLVARRALRGTLPAHFLHDPSLEMLLALYIGGSAPTALSDLFGETTVSAGVAGRWVQALVAEGLVTVTAGQATLSATGRETMHTMLAAVVRSQRDMLGWGDH